MKTATRTKTAVAPHAVILSFDGVADERLCVRSNRDRRRFVDRWIACYRDTDGNEYRKSFEVPCRVRPTYPQKGTHAELNAAEFAGLDG